MKKTLFWLLCLQLPIASADWTVDPEGSFIGFASVKNDLIAENHSFTRVSGQVTGDGAASIFVELASVETLIPIRNERMQKMLFDVASFPVAEVTSQVNPARFTSLGIGESKMVDLEMLIRLHGTELSKTVPVKVTRSHAQGFEVTSLGPVLVHASQFALADGVEALRKIAGLQSIDLMVPMTFDLHLVQAAGE
jgi:hypothetical protein